MTIAHLTLYEARRRRIVTGRACVCGRAFLAVFGAGLFFIDREQLQERRAARSARQATMSVLTLAGLYAANFLSVLLAVLLPVDTLSGEIDSGVMQTLASKPIRRADIVLGKWLGHARHRRWATSRAHGWAWCSRRAGSPARWPLQPSRSRCR